MTEGFGVPDSSRCRDVFCAVNQGVQHAVMNNQQCSFGKHPAAASNFIAQMGYVVFRECWRCDSVQHRNKLNTITGETSKALLWRNFQMIVTCQVNKSLPEL